MKKELDVIFIDDFAMSKNNKYNKEEIVDMIKAQRAETVGKSKRSYNKKTGSLNYSFYSKENKINVRIPKRYKEENEKYINIFERLCLKDKKARRLQAGLLAVGTVTVFSAGVALSEPVSKAPTAIKEFIIDLLDNPIDDLEWEVKVHGGHAWTDDRKVYPQYDHGCVFGDKDMSVEERISEYCDDNELGNEVKDAAIRKFRYYYDDQTDLAEEIDLQEIFDLSKEKGYSK